MNYFYCYSYKLMRFLKLQNESYIFKGKHPNGNQYWVFKSSDNLNKQLDTSYLYKLRLIVADSYGKCYSSKSEK